MNVSLHVPHCSLICFHISAPPWRWTSRDQSKFLLLHGSAHTNAARVARRCTPAGRRGGCRACRIRARGCGRCIGDGRGRAASARGEAAAGEEHARPVRHKGGSNKSSALPKP